MSASFGLAVAGLGKVVHAVDDKTLLGHSLCLNKASSEEGGVLCCQQGGSLCLLRLVSL
jgi:hypothetical protein